MPPQPGIKTLCLHLFLAKTPSYSQLFPVEYNNLMAIEGAIFSPRQLIDEHKNFHNDSLEAVVQALGPCGKQYYTVAIIGCQNSGKSTLLNHLFGTDFRVLQGEAGNRTTRGVVLGRDKAANLLVMDVEGNDSYESHLTGDEVENA